MELHGKGRARGKSLIDCFPYERARDVQAEVLEQIEENWNRYDVFVVVAPTATGKSAIAKSLMEWTPTSYIVPTNQLIDQFLSEFPETNTVKSAERYQCIDWEHQSCGRTKAREGGFCRGCPCARDVNNARYRGGSGVYTYYMYGPGRQIYRPTVVIDEAHNIIPTIRDLSAKRIWQHQAGYPNSVVPERPETVEAWTSSLPRHRLRAGSKLRTVHDAVTSEAPQHLLDRTLELLRGRERDCIRILPIDIREARPVLWPPGQVEKIVLLSATISEVDIRELGLDRRRVLYLECASPIEVGNRPIVPECTVNVNRYSLADASTTIGKDIRELACEYHRGEKGIIHATYQMAGLLRQHLSGDPRFLFHDRDNKLEIYQQFRESDDDRILVASGMYEGVDLPYDAGRWQVIAKIPWMSLGDKAIRHRAEEDPDWYNWNTLKDVIQACGRICRTPDDFGVTYILDSNFRKLYGYCSEAGLLPEWFAAAVQWEDGDGDLVEETGTVEEESNLPGRLVNGT